MGFGEVASEVVPDGEPVRAALAARSRRGADLVVTTGGTGLTPTDQTPEMTRAVLDYEVPGIAEAIRAYGIGKGHRDGGAVAWAGRSGRPDADRQPAGIGRAE